MQLPLADIPFSERAGLSAPNVGGIYTRAE